VAAAIQQQTGIQPEITPGSRGEFSIWVGDRKVAQKDRTGFPDDSAIVAAVQQAL
jgi:hypothetical protein